jgi:hypothetical protein
MLRKESSEIQHSLKKQAHPKGNKSQIQINQKGINVGSITYDPSKRLIKRECELHTEEK